VAVSPAPRKYHVRIGSGQPGPLDAITDVRGVRVGQTTLISGDGALEPGVGPVRTGVTIVIPHSAIWREPVLAGAERINGNGEVTGLEWLRESGCLTTPIGLTNTHSVGVVRDAIADAHMSAAPEQRYSLPVVGETFDGYLNDINGHHVTARHVFDALDSAGDGPVQEGAVGGGTGMTCHEFKGGIGTASRVISADDGGAWTVGVLVQANHGVRSRLVINGVPVGAILDSNEVPLPGPAATAPGAGSIIVIVATDAPLLPHQCCALAKRAGFGIARTGGAGERDSGDFAIAFSTGNRLSTSPSKCVAEVRTVTADAVTPLYYGTIEAVEQAIVNALVAAETMTGADGHSVHGLPAERLLGILKAHRKQMEVAMAPSATEVLS
jgi:D-aminopeptidase